MSKNIFGHRFDGADNVALSDTFSNVDGSAALGLNDPLVQEFSNPTHSISLPLNEPLSDSTITSSGFPAVFELSSLDGTNGFEMNGVASSDDTGDSVALAGDINGDGFSDVIVGAPGADKFAGAAYVLFGHASPFGTDFELSSLNGNNGFILSHPEISDSLGTSVASAGDLNGDGLADIIVGSPFGFSSGTGDAYVVFGHIGKFDTDIDISTLNGANGFVISNSSGEDGAARSVASAGDVNGDGFADIIVGAPSDDDFAGASYVIFGHAGGFDPNIDVAKLERADGVRVDGPGGDAGSGSSVASAGDVNGDGFADIIVGAPDAYEQSGGSYVVFGGAHLPADIVLSKLNGTNGFKIVRGGESAGFSVASAGDINGDGFADIIVGAPYADSNGGIGSASGVGYVIFGHADGFGASVDPTSLNGKSGFAIEDQILGDEVGFSVGSAGDVNGDGFDDFLISAPEGGDFAGATYVVFGHTGRFSANFDLSTLDGTSGFVIAGAGANDHSGHSVSGGGDINGDGFDDIIVGAYGVDTNGSYAGASYVIFGQAPTEAVTRIGSIASQAISGGAFDDTLSGLGGNDTLHGNDGDDHLIGGGGTDVLDGGKGADTMEGGAGNDTYIVNNIHDVVTEAVKAGTDTVETNLTSYTLGDNVEHLVYTGVRDFAGTGNRLANVITGGDLGDTLSGLSGNDTLNGGSGDDVLMGGAGADRLIGGAGADTFQYASAAESSSTHHDTVVNVNFAQDHFDLAASVTAISAAVTSGSLSGASFDADLAADIGNAQLGRHHAVLFTASAGDMAGHTFLIVDANGRAGYQAGHDYVFDITGAHNIADLSAAAFV